MIEYPPGADMFATKVDIMVCPVNLVPGVMGKGLAQAFAKKWPDLKNSHRDCINRGSLLIDKPVFVGIEQQVIFIATKRHWRDPSNTHDIRLALGGLRKLLGTAAAAIQANSPGFKGWSIAIPALGCGLGKLDWALVRPMILTTLDGLPLDIHLYPPHET